MGERLGDFVVNTLVSPLLNKGYIITCDNFFTSLKLAQDLLEKKTALVDTVRMNSKFLSEDPKI